MLEFFEYLKRLAKEGEGRILKKNINFTQVAKELNVNAVTLSRWLKQLKETESIIEEKDCYRIGKVYKREEHKALSALEDSLEKDIKSFLLDIGMRYAKGEREFWLDARSEVLWDIVVALGWARVKKKCVVESLKMGKG